MKTLIPLIFIATSLNFAFAQNLSDFLFFPKTTDRSIAYDYISHRGKISVFPGGKGGDHIVLSVKRVNGPEFVGDSTSLSLGVLHNVSPFERIFIPTSNSGFWAENFSYTFPCSYPKWVFPNFGTPTEFYNAVVTPSRSAPKFPLLGSEAYRSTPYDLCESALPNGKSLASDWLGEFELPSIITLTSGLKIEVIRLKAWRRALAVDAPAISSGLTMDYVFGHSIGFLFANPTDVPDDLGYINILNNSFGKGPLERAIPSPLAAPDNFPALLSEGNLIEYLNTEDFPKSPGGQFFYTKDVGEQAALDAGSAGKFKRTGRAFSVGGYVPVCRFYGSQAPGPNSHFFSAEPGECDAVKKLQVSPKPTATQQWNSEGTAFYAVLPMIDTKTLKPTCIPSTIPVYRAYNNAFTASGAKNAWDSNHRYSTSQADIDEMVRSHRWKDEGLVYCVPG